MTRLAITSTALGGLIIATRFPGIVWPESFRKLVLQFPRSVMTGRILMAIAALIAWVVMYQSATDEWAFARPLILIGVPIAYILVVQYGDQFLSLRATAALILLVAKQMVDATDVSDAPLRLVVTVLAYLMVIMAAWVTIAPHIFRDVLGYCMASNKRCRVTCGLGLCVGIGLVALGLCAY
jgi:hypothetical protein